MDNPFTAATPHSILTRQVSGIVEDALKETGVNPSNPSLGKGELKSIIRRSVMRTHGMRKFFVNQCAPAHIDYTTREFLVGHKLPRQEASYNRMTEEDRLFGSSGLELDVMQPRSLTFEIVTSH